MKIVSVGGLKLRFDGRRGTIGRVAALAFGAGVYAMILQQSSSKPVASSTHDASHTNQLYPSQHEIYFDHHLGGLLGLWTQALGASTSLKSSAMDAQGLARLWGQ
jgi:hypothetical protein